MNRVSLFLARLRERGVVVRLGENGLLQIDSKQGAMTPEIMDELKLHKSRILAFLRMGVGREYVCSFQQERLCFLDKFEEGEMQAYSMPYLLLLQGEIDVSILEDSLRTIIRRHEVMRSNFVEIDMEYRQIVGDHERFDLVRIDANENDIKGKVEAELAKSFDLESDLLFRATLFHVSDYRYYLLVNMHHIVSDGWSIDLLIREFSTLYVASKEHVPDPLPPLPIQYGDYAQWQREHVNESVLSEKLDFWKRELSSIDVLKLPTTYTRPAAQTYKGARLPFSVTAEMNQRLHALARQHDATLFMVLFGAFSLLLYRYSEQQDVVVGSPVANRSRTEVEGLIGFFANTLPFKVVCNGQKTFTEFLAEIKRKVLKIYGHQDVPFERIVEALNVPRDASHSPLFQTMFVLQNTQHEKLVLPSMTMEPIELNNETSKFDLTMELIEQSGRLDGILEYATDLFSQEFAHRFTKHFQTLVADICENEHKKLSEYSLMTREEESKLMEWGTARGSYCPCDKSVHEIFEERVKDHPDSLAVIYEEETLTYQALNEKANKIAHYLVEKGIKRGDIVALVLDRSMETIIGLLGILKAGGAYLSIDTHYPSERIDYITKDSSASMVLEWDTIRDAVAAPYPCNDLKLNSHGSDLIYLSYTSGSTGKPKGVMVEHRNVSRLVMDQHYLPFDDEIVFLQASSVAFDAATLEIFGALLSGGQLVLYPDSRLDMVLLNDTIEKNKINTIWLTSALFEQWVFALREELPSLKYVLAGGDVLNAHAVNQLHQKLSNVTIINGYGPTENTTFSTTYCCSRDVDYDQIPIGKPINNTNVYILDTHRNLVPAGVEGELHVGGEGVTRGYINQPELTQKSFFVFRGDRVYKTGDIVKLGEDGNLIYLARSDHQVKIRGFRIELGEIEKSILQIDGTEECAVIEQEKRLFAFVTIENRATIKGAHIQKELARMLPEYMIPFSVNILKKLPTNSNGKVDRNALKKLEVAPMLSGEFVAPNDKIEIELAEIFKEVLGIDKVGIHDNFFELGGHSLLATKMVAYIRAKLMIDVPLKQLFSAPTILELKEYIQSRRMQSAVPKIIKQSNDVVAPLSYAQERLWFLDKFEAGDMSAYNIPYLLRLKGTLDVVALESSFKSIVERHTILRTNFIENETLPHQVVRGHVFQLERREDTQAGMMQAVEQKLTESFDLKQDLLLRATLFCVEEKDHYLFINMHHIVSDGWSVDVFIREFMLLYQMHSEGAENSLSSLEVQYADYACWQRDYLKDSVLEKKLQYYKKSIANAVPLRLPLQFKRPAVPSYRGARVAFVVPENITRDLNNLSRSYGATLFMTLLGAFGILMQRYSGQSDFVVGSPVANRGQREVENLIGFFINILPLRIELGDETFVALLGKIKELTLSAYEHQDLPFEKIVEALDIPRDTSVSPLFQVLFVLQNNQQTSLVLPDLLLEPVAFENPTSKFDLTVELNETQGRIEGALEYATDLFDRDFMQGVAKHFVTLLSEIVRNEHRYISEYDIIVPAKREMMVTAGSAVKSDSLEKPLHQLIDEQAIRTPRNIALVFEDQHVQYDELIRMANRLANHLIQKGIELEDIVALHLDRSIEMVVGILGILKAGGAYLPMDTSYPQGRIDYILADSQAKEILSQADIKQILNDSHNDASPRQKVEPTNLAYVIYTSGSTGKPKGVMVEHQGAVNRLLWQIKELGMDESDVVLQKTPFTFDVSVWELLLPLMCGAKEVIAKPGGHKESTYISRVIVEAEITTIHFVPSMLSAILEEKDFIDSTSCLRRVVCSGEALPFRLVKDYHLLHRPPLYNLYGPTEASIDVTSFYCSPDDLSGGSIPIGKPIDNIQLFILDPYLHFVPDGVVGELYIGGIGLARGYRNNPVLTKECFVTHQGKRLYKTGDLVKRLSDGNIDYIGRIDYQVKLRGLRIELGEIEQQLQAIPSVKESVVLIKDENLIAYITKADHLELSMIKTELSGQLVDYMMPTHIEVIDAMPLTSNGKIDRKALAGLTKKIQLENVFTPPRNKTEKELATIFEALLGIEKAGVHDNFFDLGGHSLLATQMVYRIRSEMHADISLKDIFSHATIEALGALINQADIKVDSSIKKVTDRSNIPLSYAQERLWFLDRYERGVMRAYSMPTLLKLTGDLDIERVESSFARIVHRHEILRTNFDGRQRIHDERNFHMEVIRVAQENIKEDVHRRLRVPFDLEKGMLFSVTLYVVEAKVNYLFINMHHIVSDGWSLEIIVEEFLHLYGGEILEELPIQYGDFSQWQREYLAGDLLQKKIEYWRKNLEDAQTLNLPTTYPRPSVQSYKGDRVTFSIDAKITGKLNAMSRAHDVTLFMTLISAFGVLLGRYAGQRDFVIGSPVANRHRVELEKLIGFFINTLPFRFEIENQSTFQQQLQKNKDQILNGYEHQDVPFEKIVDSLNLPRDASMSPLHQVMFVLQNIKQTKIVLPEIGVEFIEITNPTSKYDLTMELIEKDGKLEGVLEYATDLFSQQFIKGMARNFVTLLGDITEKAEQPLSTLKILTSEEERTLLAKGTQTETQYPRDKTVVELFEEKARRFPQKIAITHADKHLTYEQLAVASNQMAHYLSERGIKSEDVVALSMMRSLEMMIAIFGVLKVGAAYLPLDTSYPEERIEFMIEDSGALLVLSSADVRDAMHSQSDDVELDAIVLPTSLAYILYTSGSTGKPKGVMGTHRNITRLVLGQDYIAFNEEIKILQVASVSFDAFIFETYGALLNGGTLFLYPHEHLDIDKLNGAIEKHQVNTLLLTAVLFEQWSYASFSAYKLPLKYVLTGGERVNPKAVNTLHEKLPDTIILNAYGPTENATITTVYSCDRNHEYLSVPIGKPIANTTTYVLDDTLNAVPVGVVGELYAGGDGLAEGYLNLPELTEERFFEFNGERIYKTGDLVKYSEDGNLQYIGRTDNQVKLRGFRIELDEIEKHLSQLAGVQECAVLLKEQMIIAFYVGNPHQPREQLLANLPEYMVPSVIEEINEMPITSNGKIDKKSLMGMDVKFEPKAFVEPRDETEKKLADIYEKVLGVKRVGIHDNFFDLGGNSILSIQVANQAKRANIPLEVKDIFMASTINKLSEYLKEKAHVQRVISLEDESFLEKDIVPIDPLSSADGNIFLTGATGFLGIYLLAELMRNKQNTVSCLVRGKTREEAKQRIKNMLTKYHLPASDIDSRVIIVLGDLSKEKMGISQEEYTRLSQTVTRIYHSASYMNSMVSYEVLKEVNVGGIKEVLRFASTGIAKQIDYVSTADVFSYESQSVADEYTPLSDQIHFASNGYASSKFVAENILFMARERGFDINLYRVGLITGDTTHGCNEESQWFHNLIKSILAIGCMVDMPFFEISITPVDYVAKALVSLSGKYRNDVFHLSSPLMVLFGDLVRYNDIEITDLYTLVQKIKAYNASHQEELYLTQFVNELLGLNREEMLEFEYTKMPEWKRKTLIMTHNTMEKLDIPFPEIGSKLLGQYFDSQNCS